STMTISVPQQSASLKPFSSGKSPLALAALLLPLAAFRKRRKHIRLLVLLLAGLSGMGLISGCGMGNKGGYFSQSEKSYTVTVTGTSGSLVHSTTVTLTVE
ncbi:MAG: hypothetical protein FWD64_06970, partial [Acidobacteriaceae bacterium]|nr:hypothetical protein [Acidobacteriaceae bacterium]